MRDERSDIRVTKTCLALANALVELMEEKGFRKITVRDICGRAMVGRSTFYLHFEDKYELALFCLEQLKRQIEDSVKIMEPRDVLHLLARSVYAKQKMFRALIQADEDVELTNMLKNFFHGFFIEAIAKENGENASLPGPIPLLAAYYSGGLAAMTFWWINNDFPISEAALADCQYHLLEGLLRRAEMREVGRGGLL